MKNIPKKAMARIFGRNFLVKRIKNKIFGNFFRFLFKIFLSSRNSNLEIFIPKKVEKLRKFLWKLSSENTKKEKI